MTVDRKNLDDLRIDRSGEKVRSGRSRNWIIVIVILAAIAAMGWWASRPAAAEVQVATVADGSTGGGEAAVLNASGYVTARREATVSSKVTGKVVEVLIEEGMKVSEGQLLARLDPATASAAYRLAESQAKAAASSLAETKVRIAQARLDLGRAQSLTTQKVASQAALDQAKADLDALEAHLASQRDDYAVARRQLDLRKQDLDDTEIRAPFAGIVVSKNAQPGEMISPISAGGGFTRTGICTVVDMASLEIEVDVNEAYINRVHEGQKVEAVLDAYPDWKIPAHVITVIPTADRQKATVKVRIAFDQRDARILPDMGVKVSFIEDDPKSAVRAALDVPRDALRRDGDRDVVYVVRDGRVERRAVTVQSTDGETAKISTGLSAGEKVVVSGPDELRDGERVRIAEEKNG